MKTSIYDLLGMIKDNKAPRKIVFKEEVYTFDYEEYDYIATNGDGLFDYYATPRIIDDEVTILETTITYNGVQKCTEVNNEIEKIEPFKEEVNIVEFALKYPEVAKVLKSYEKKIAKLIEVVNKL